MFWTFGLIVIYGIPKVGFNKGISLQISLLLIGRDEFRIKCSTYEKENLDLSERVSRT